MVQVIPPKTNLGSQIGQALGGGLQQGLQQGLSRGLLQQALGKVKNLAQTPGVKPLDLMLGLMEAGAGIPGSERYLGALLQPLLTSATAGLLGNLGQGQGGGLPQGEGEQPSGGGAQNGTGQPTTFGPSQGTVPGSSDRPLTMGSYIPLDIGNLVSPEQQNKILTQIGQAGGDINFAKDRINEYNEGKITFNELANTNVNRAWAQRQRELALESDITGRIGQKVGAQEPEGYKSVAYNMVKPYIDRGMDFNSAWLKAEPDFNNFKREIAKFEAGIPAAGTIESTLGFAPEELNKWYSKGRAITEKYPAAYPILQEFFTNKGHNIIATSHALNPLPSPVSKALDSSKDYRSELYKPSGFGGGGPDIEQIFNNQMKDAAKLSDSLAQQWNPNISIINIFGELRARGWLPNAAHALIDDLRSKVKFSSQQEVEANEVLQNPPLPLFERKGFRK